MKGKILLPSTHTLMAPDLTVINQELKGSTDTKEARSLLGVIRKEIVFFFKWSFINLWCGHIWNIAYSSGHGISKTIYWYLFNTFLSCPSSKEFKVVYTVPLPSLYPHNNPARWVRSRQWASWLNRDLNPDFPIPSLPLWPLDYTASWMNQKGATKRVKGSPTWEA